jgi:hypothetical protein
MDPAIVFTFWSASQPWREEVRYWALSLLLVWMVLGKVVKFVNYYDRRPQDIYLIPVSIMFGYVHSLVIKLWAVMTLNEVSSNAGGAFPMCFFGVILPEQIPTITILNMTSLTPHPSLFIRCPNTPNPRSTTPVYEVGTRKMSNFC